MAQAMAPHAPGVYGVEMGRLYYDGHPDPVVVDDDELAHVKAVVVTKLRRREGFLLSWTEARQRVAIWVAPAIDLRFEFDAVTPPATDPARLERIAAESATGSITFTPSP
jgi:hypothetical protein